jgi:hypothetical protein
MEAAGARRHRRLDAQHDSATRYHRGRTDAFVAGKGKIQISISFFFRLAITPQNRKKKPYGNVHTALLSATPQ